MKSRDDKKTESINESGASATSPGHRSPRPIDEELDRVNTKIRAQKLADAEQQRKEQQAREEAREAARANTQQRDLGALKQFVNNVITAQRLDYLYRNIEEKDRYILFLLKPDNTKEQDRARNSLQAFVNSFTVEDIQTLEAFLNKAENGVYKLYSRLPADADAFLKAVSIPDIVFAELKAKLEELRHLQLNQQLSQPAAVSATKTSSFFATPDKIPEMIANFEQTKDEDAFLESLYKTDPKKLAAYIKRPPAQINDRAMHLMKECDALNQVIAHVGKIKQQNYHDQLSKIYERRQWEHKLPTEYLSEIGVTIIEKPPVRNVDKGLWVVVKKIAQIIDKTCNTHLVTSLAKGAETAKIESTIASPKGRGK